MSERKLSGLAVLIGTFFQRLVGGSNGCQGYGVTRGSGRQYRSSSCFYYSGQINDKGYVKMAQEKGIITGYPDGSFGPYRQATRAEASVMIIRMINNR